MFQLDKVFVLLFYGWFGIGKNFVVWMLVENLYWDGLMSDCVRMFIVMFYFFYCKYVDLYKEQLMGQIWEMQQFCYQILFIFDEVEKLYLGLLEVFELYLECWVFEGYRVEFIWIIFLFFSNFRGDIINEVVLKLFKVGWFWEEIMMEYLEFYFQVEIVEIIDNGFGYSCFVKENLIDYFIFFLLLEYYYVRLCVWDVFLSQEFLYIEEILDEIVQMMVYVFKEE